MNINIYIYTYLYCLGLWVRMEKTMETTILFRSMTVPHEVAE